MKKAYLVILENTFNFETSLDIKVFKSYEKAKENMEKTIKDLKSKGEFDNWEVKDEGKDYLELYDDGNYLENHIDMIILERELED